MLGIDNCIPETNHVSSICNVAAILLLKYVISLSIFSTKYSNVMLFPMLNDLYFHINTLRSRCALPIWLHSVLHWSALSRYLIKYDYYYYYYYYISIIIISSIIIIINITENRGGFCSFKRCGFSIARHEEVHFLS